VIATLTQTRRAIGRIGLEFDSGGVYCAQVRRQGAGWQMIHSRAVAVQEQEPQAESGSPELFRATDLIQAAVGFRGSEIAGVLPMEACDLRVLELPSSNRTELRMMIANETEGETDSSVFDFWTLPAGMTPRKDLTGVCSLSADRQIIANAVQRIHAGGFTIAGVDGLPTACARATGMMDQSGTGIQTEGDVSLRMAVHIGWNRCTLVLVRDGAPLLARVPQSQGLWSFLESAASSISLTPRDLLRVVRGLHNGLPIQLKSGVTSRLQEAVRAWSLPLCEEVLRSIAFSRRPGLRMLPGAVVLMGTGATIPCLSGIMTDELNMTAQLWRLPAEEGIGGGPEFAAAAALSAWEIDA
jgi:Tfp pilus assembly PilM family ATPase